MTTVDKTGGRFGPVKRFIAIFFIICAVVAAISAAQSAGSAMVVLIVVAVACLVVGVALARASFAALQKREF